MRVIKVLLAGALLLGASADVSSARRAQAEAKPIAARAVSHRVPELEAAQRPPADLPIDHWAYPLLERLVARGALDLDLSTRPLPRSEVRAAIVLWREARLQQPTGWERLSGRESWMMRRLVAEFLGCEVDRPALVHRDGDASVGMGILMGTRVAYADDDHQIDSEYEPADDNFSTNVDISYELWGGLAGIVGFYAETDIVLGGQEGERVVRLSSHTREWRGVTATVDRAYFKYERPHLSVAAGRRAPAWGRARWGRLLVSGEAQPFDQVDAAFRLGPLSFHALHARIEYSALGNESALDEDETVFLAGHRMVVSGARGSIGVSECVVYSSVLPDPVYVNPLAPYYLLQHNERENDNVLWSMDWTYRAARGWTAYGEFLVDDLQYERSTGSPDKYGVTLGQVWYGALGGSDVELTAEYSQVRKWTYTHSHVEHRFAHDGDPIGFDLGPDSDRLTLEGALSPSAPWTVVVRYAHSREGEGSLAEPFSVGDNADTSFPSGEVETSDLVTVELEFDDLDERRGGVGVSFERTEGSDDVWRAWASFGFRI